MRPPADDLDRLMLVMDAAFPAEFNEAWNRRQVEDALLIGNCHYILVDGDGNLAPDQDKPIGGFALSRSGFGEEELLLFAVHPDFRRKGLGRILLEELAIQARLRRAEMLFLEMRDGNSAESLYRDFGFVQIGRRPGYYRTASGSRIDALTFSRSLA